jgi:GrpB-like predicted nucleotidyltransferase (UPF0157 family)
MSIILEPYNQKWKDEFDALKAVFETALADLYTDIQHVGSTAVPGSLAKPILDIDLIISDKNGLGGLSERLTLLGYKSKGEQGIAGRFAFRQVSDFAPIVGDNKRWQQHHLYVCFDDSLALKNHLLFRDILLKDKALVEAYSRLKEKLAAEQGMTREYYTLRKAEFINNILSSNTPN